MGTIIILSGSVLDMTARDAIGANDNSPYSPPAKSQQKFNANPDGVSVNAGSGAGLERTTLL